MKIIAIVDDDIPIGDMLEELLKKNGYEVIRAYSGTEALLLFEQQRPDLVLLDLMLPGLPGEEVMLKIQAIPVIVLSAKVDVRDKVNLFKRGAVDYMTKPFDTEELLARMEVRLRRDRSDSEQSLLSAGDLRMDMVSREITVCNEPVHLTKTEFAILKLLMNNAGSAIAKTVILDRICEDTPDCTDSSLKQHISNLRKKLKDISGEDYIEAVWGIGFKLVVKES